MKRCALLSRGTDMELGEMVYEKIKKLIADGVTEFYSTGAGGFCDLCEGAARELGARVVFVPYDEEGIKKNDLSCYSGMICLFNIFRGINSEEIDSWVAENCDMSLCAEADRLIVNEKNRLMN